MEKSEKYDIYNVKYIKKLANELIDAYENDEKILLMEDIQDEVYKIVEINYLIMPFKRYFDENTLNKLKQIVEDYKLFSYFLKYFENNEYEKYDYEDKFFYSEIEELSLKINKMPDYLIEYFNKKTPKIQNLINLLEENKRNFDEAKKRELEEENKRKLEEKNKKEEKLIRKLLEIFIRIKNFYYKTNNIEETKKYVLEKINLGNESFFRLYNLVKANIEEKDIRWFEEIAMECISKKSGYTLFLYNIITKDENYIEELLNEYKMPDFIDYRIYEYFLNNNEINKILEFEKKYKEKLNELGGVQYLRDKKKAIEFFDGLKKCHINNNEKEAVEFTNDFCKKRRLIKSNFLFKVKNILKNYLDSEDKIWFDNFVSMFFEGKTEFINDILRTKDFEDFYYHLIVYSRETPSILRTRIYADIRDCYLDFEDRLKIDEFIIGFTDEYNKNKEIYDEIIKTKEEKIKKNKVDQAASIIQSFIDSGLTKTQYLNKENISAYYFSKALNVLKENKSSIVELCENHIKKQHEIIKTNEERTIKISVDQAISVIQSFIDSGLTKTQYLNKENISAYYFSKALNVLKENENPIVELYENHIKKEQTKRFMRVVGGIRKLVSEINLGIKNTDESVRNFDLIDFYKRTSLTLAEVLEFAKKYLQKDEYYILKEFVAKNTPDRRLMPDKIAEIYKTKTIINVEYDEQGNFISDSGIELPKKIKQSFIWYLNVNGIPLTERTYRCVLNRYKNGIIKFKTPEKQEIDNEVQEKTLPKK